MTQGKIYTQKELTSDVDVTCDVCVVGSGSGGAWTALELVRQGKSVVMLEEGGYHTRREFDMTESRAFVNLYQELGNRGTDDLSLTILQGRSVGGSTTVNWCSSFRTPDRILKYWQAHSGIDTLSTEVLTPHWDFIEKRLRIAEWPLEAVNENNKVLWEGLGSLGYGRGLIRRNVNNCLNLGYCGMGCPVDAKQSMLVTTLPDAVELGMTLYADTSARTIEWAGRKVSAVRAEVVDGVTRRPTGIKVTIRPKLLVVSGGAVNSPALLLRSGFESEGRVGQRSWFHPVVVSTAMFDKPIQPFSGAPQSVYSHHFVDRGPGKIGYLLEVPPMHPMLASSVATGEGSATQDLIANLPHLNGMIALAVDGLLPEEEGGTVRLRQGGYNRHSISYTFIEAHWEAFKNAQKEMARIQFAAGAKQVTTLHAEPVVMNGPNDIAKIDNAAFEPLKMKVMSAHAMGGCAMGKNPDTSVVDGHLRYHSMDNLFVVDGSVFPTALGVNPQLTIFGIARWAAGHIGKAV
jgi:choline dehydrogenase-like flavoprotein